MRQRRYPYSGQKESTFVKADPISRKDFKTT